MLPWGLNIDLHFVVQSCQVCKCWLSCALQFCLKLFTCLCARPCHFPSLHQLKLDPTPWPAVPQHLTPAALQPRSLEAAHGQVSQGR